jgi:hypothetical protein
MSAHWIPNNVCRPTLQVKRRRKASAGKPIQLRRRVSHATIIFCSHANTSDISGMFSYLVPDWLLEARLHTERQ